MVTLAFILIDQSRILYFGSFYAYAIPINHYYWLTAS
jgi:hypothetical protein